MRTRYPGWERQADARGYAALWFNNDLQLALCCVCFDTWQLRRLRPRSNYWPLMITAHTLREVIFDYVHGTLTDTL